MSEEVKMGTSVIERCEVVAEQYPFSGAMIFNLYLSILENEKHRRMNKTTDEIFDIIMRILDISAIYQINPFSVVTLIYSNDVMRLFRQ